MSVPHSLLAILSDKPTHGYGLKAEFEKSTAGTWPLNVGQVYTTLARLQRDGLVATVGVHEGPRQTWRITASGRAQLDEWYKTPISEDPPPRDELAIKVLLAIAADGTDVSAILQQQRTATLERLQQFTRHKMKADPAAELPWLLLLDALILKAEAEVRWLDICEARLKQRSI
ncbi:MAG: PadR family transcriptional regulator [Planctomycetota bacterium]